MPVRYRVAITRRVSSDLEQIHSYIAKDSPQNAANFISELLKAIDSLELFPHRIPFMRGGASPVKRCAACRSCRTSSTIA